MVRQLSRSGTGDDAMLIVAVLALSTHAMLEFPLDYAYFLLPLGLWIGALHTTDGNEKFFSLPRWTFFVPFLVLVGLLGRIGVEYMRTEEAARTLRFVMLGIGVDKVSSAPEPEVALLDRPRLFHRYMLSTAREGLTDQELQAVREIARRHAFPPSLFRLAVVLGINGHADEAARTLALLCQIHPLTRCIEAQDAWRAMQLRYTSLNAIPPPRLPVAPGIMPAGLPR